jgi:hypothetical protein
LLPALVLVVSGCTRGDVYDDVALPPTPVVTLRPTWALVRTPYLRLYTDTNSSSPIAGHLRSGDIAEISAIGTRLINIDGEAERWYLLQTEEARGWTPGAALELFTSQERARNATRNSSNGE